MKNLVKHLCLLVLTFNCASNLLIRKFEENEKIETPENCTWSSFKSRIVEEFLDDVQCDNFYMRLREYTNKYDDDVQVYHEYKTTITCTFGPPPYKYLRNANSNRNSLQITGCQPPASGSFGDGWPRLEYLTIIDNVFETQPLKREYFSGLNNLWSLQLLTNKEMPDDLFADLPNLKKLYMTIKCVNKRLFANLSKLESLQITIQSNESINNFDTSELKYAPKLKDLKLHLNNITHITKRFFEGCSNVINLVLTADIIGVIDFDALESLTKVKNIEIACKKLTSLPEGLFSKNKYLENVEIRSKSVTPIPLGFLSNLPNLSNVLIYCKLTSVPNDLIHGSNNLEMLDLQYNELTSIPRDFFKNHSKLKVVKLYKNKFPIFPHDFFVNKSSIVEFRFDDVDDHYFRLAEYRSTL